MTANGWLQIALYSVVLLALTKPTGMYMVRVYEGSLTWLRPLERFLYRLGGVDPEEDQHWTKYTAAMLIFSAVSMLLTYLVLRLQHLLPFNPQHLPAVADRQAFETAASFTTNTNWQSYVGESTMSYLSQMNQLAFHNFMDRLIQRNVIAMSGRAVEAAGDVDTLLLDKTGTITLGNRQAAKFWPAPGGVTEQELADAAQLASLADETPEGRSIVVLAKTFGIRGRELNEMNATFVPFTAQTRMSGIDIGERRIRKGAPDAIDAWLKAQGKAIDRQLRAHVDQIASKGATPLVVAENGRALGVIELRDIVKGGIKERFAQLRRMAARLPHNVSC